MLVTSSPKIDLVDVDGLKPASARDYYKVGAQVLVDEEPEL
jgi:hypothetical protein